MMLTENLAGTSAENNADTSSDNEAISVTDVFSSIKIEEDGSCSLNLEITFSDGDSVGEYFTGKSPAEAFREMVSSTDRTIAMHEEVKRMAYMHFQHLLEK